MSEKSDFQEHLDKLNNLVGSGRLRDISDLPFDLIF